jgi:hypothetical protein
MKTVLAIAVAASVAVSAYAQLSPVPPTEGLLVNGPQASWTGSQLEDYYFATDNNLGTPNMGSPDNVDGLSWSHSVNSAVSAALASINTTGGTVRAIFVGESAGWKNNFGYAYDGNAWGANSFSLFNNIQAPGNPANGTYADILLSAGQASTFDFWLDGVGTSNNEFGGVYDAIHQSNSVPDIAPGNVKWATSALQVPTFVQSLNGGLGGVENVNTYLVGFEDWRLDNGNVDRDYNDFVFAIQLFDKDGTPFTPVPEPSTYGLIGAAALLGLVARRRFASKK